jgi:hypothetical protein
MPRVSARAIDLVTGAAVIAADSFRDAYIATGMNLVQTFVLCTLALGRRLIAFSVQDSEEPRTLNANANREP